MSKEYESEAMLEEKLIKHLELLGYTRISLKNIDDVKVIKQGSYNEARVYISVDKKQ